MFQDSSEMEAVDSRLSQGVTVQGVYNNSVCMHVYVVTISAPRSSGLGGRPDRDGERRLKNGQKMLTLTESIHLSLNQ